MMIDAKNLSEMSNAVRATALKTIKHAKSGHVGIVLGAADIVTIIYAVFMRRGIDRFVLSAGHGSALLYSVLKLAGYKIGDLDSFRRLNGLAGHPEYGMDGVDATTGPLGQGIANAIGMAMAAKHKGNDGRVFCLCSDGDLMEGVAQEAIGFAGHYDLDNLVVLWDDNGISMDGVAQTDINVPARMRAAGWTVRTVDGTNFDELFDAIDTPATGPVFVQCKTILGVGTSVAGTPVAHSLSIDDTEIDGLVATLKSENGLALWKKLARTSRLGRKTMMRGTVPNFSLPQSFHLISSREMSTIILDRMVKRGLDVVIGAADVGTSTGVRVPSARDITRNDFSGNYINYGVREHAMAAIMNGFAYAGVRAIGGAFLAFSDYMRGAIRLSALAGLPVVYVFTHDSVAVGQDGPTHQPVEQIASLRMIPNMNVFRPCNMTEVAYAWRVALSETNRPTCIILSRQKLGWVGKPIVGYVDAGGYVVYKPRSGRVRMTILATGSEVPLAIAVAARIGRGIQVASIPSVADFRQMDADYKKKILRGRVVAIEAAATAPWFEFADYVIGIDQFGKTGPGDLVYSDYGFDVDLIVDALRKKLKHV